jgi:hypothetical protein
MTRALPLLVMMLLGLPAALRAADLTVLEQPGAVHLQPGQPIKPDKPSSFSLPLVSPAQAATRAGGASSPATIVPAVRLTGVIGPGDADKLRKVLDKLARAQSVRPEDPLTTIELSSMGGSLTEGFEIGHLFRQYKVISVVRSHDLCMSSCALAFLGGNIHRVPVNYPTRCNVEIGSKIGFHNFFLNPNGLAASTENDPVASRFQGFLDARGGAASLVRYAADVGMPPSFVASLMGRPVDQFQYIETVRQFLALNVCPIGLGRPAAPLEQQARNVCRNALGGPAPASDLEVSEIRADQAKRYLLEVLQAEMLASGRSRGRLASLFANGAVMRVQEEIDRLYEDLRAAGMALPDIVGPTFEVGSAQSGKYEPICYVSLSASDPDSFDVVASGRRVLSDPPHLPPGNARRLFLHDPDEVINPRP